MPDRNLLPNRDVALAYLAERQPSRLRVATQTLEHIDTCLASFESLAPNTPLAAACGLALVKGRNFAVCSLGLITDGYGQESGVLLRLLVEHIEVLIYLDRFPDEAQRALANDLPSAGARAKKIEGSFKFLRDFLNENSSHGSFSEHAVGHVRRRDGGFNKQPKFVPSTFDENFRLTAMFTIFLLRSAVSCLRHLDQVAFDENARYFDHLLGRARHVFSISAAEEA